MKNNQGKIITDKFSKGGCMKGNDMENSYYVRSRGDYHVA